jgi:predicted transcriptional regulator
MNATTVITTTISPKILSWVNQFAKKYARSRRAIIEEALQRYRNEMKRQDLIASFQRAAKDAEMLELADQGLSDYLDQLSSLES